MNRLRPRRSLQRILDDLPIRQIGNRCEAEQFCDYLGRCVVPDPRLMVWALDVVSVYPFVIRGYVTNPFGLNALHRASASLGIECDTRQVLPLPENGAYLFGLAHEPQCPLFSHPEESSREDTVHAREPLVVIWRMETHSLVHVPNGYLGWVKNSNYHTISPAEWIERISPSSPSAILLQKRTHLCESAKTMLHTPYVWGGTTAEGIDCSGFVQHLYRDLGIHLARDADQQFAAGILSALPSIYDGLRAGDLLFFSGEFGGISHVGMALDAASFIHARGGKGVEITPIAEDPELMTRFLLAKRIIF